MEKRGTTARAGVDAGRDLPLAGTPVRGNGAAVQQKAGTSSSVESAGAALGHTNATLSLAKSNNTLDAAPAHHRTSVSNINKTKDTPTR